MVVMNVLMLVMRMSLTCTMRALMVFVIDVYENDEKRHGF